MDQNAGGSTSATTSFLMGRSLSDVPPQESSDSKDSTKRKASIIQKLAYIVKFLNLFRKERSPLLKESSATMSLMGRALQEVLVSAETFAFKYVQSNEGYHSDSHDVYANTSNRMYRVQDEVCQILFQGFKHQLFDLDAISSDKKQCWDYKVSQPDEDWYFKEFQKFFFSKTGEPVTDHDFQAYFESKSVLMVSKRYYVQEIGSLFIKLLILVWALHKLAFSFNPKATIFHVQQGQIFDPSRMQQVIEQEDKGKVAYMILPGFQVGKNIFKAHVCLESSV